MGLRKPPGGDEEDTAPGVERSAARPRGKVVLPQPAGMLAPRGRRLCIATTGADFCDTWGVGWGGGGCEHC